MTLTMSFIACGLYQGRNMPNIQKLGSPRSQRFTRGLLTHRGVLLVATLLFFVVLATVQFQLGRQDLRLQPSVTQLAPIQANAEEQEQDHADIHKWNERHEEAVARLPGDHSSKQTADALEDGAATPAVPQMCHPIWWLAPFYSTSGLGIEALSMVTSLLDAHALNSQDLWLTHAGDTYDALAKAALPSKLQAMVEERSPAAVAAQEASLGVKPRRAVAVCQVFFDCWLLEGDTALAHPGCPCPPNPENVTYRIARTMFETEHLPAHLVAHCNAMDEVWVPTEWNRAGFAASGVASGKLRVVPEAIDTEEWQPDKVQPLQLDKTMMGAAAWATGPESWPVAVNGTEPFVLLSVGKWEARKGWSELLEAYHGTFGPDDPVLLLIITKPFMGSGYNFAENIRQLVAKRMKKAPAGSATTEMHKLARVRVMHQHLDDALFRQVYRSVHVLVAPTHGEGWGRPQMEAMSMGLPVITTNWSGPTAFINDKVAYPLAIDGVVTAHSSFGYFDGQRWAQPSVSHLKQLMRHVYEHREEAAAKGRAARAHLQEHFTPQALAKVLARELARVQAKLAVAGDEHG